MTDTPPDHEGYSADQQARLLSIAWASAASALDDPNAEISVGDDESYLREPRGCFVTLHNRAGQLRGCLGTFDDSRPLIENLIAMAGASTRDPRFVDNPVTLDELGDLDLEVSILTPRQPIADPLQLKLGEDGIYITGKRFGNPVTGCFLPQVPIEHGWDTPTMLSMCCSHKMGLDPDAWRPPTSLTFHTFRSIVITE